MAGGGQTIADRLTAAKYSLAGQGLAKSVCKATTEELIGPKKKHLDYLLHCTNEPNVSIPQMANLLLERTQNSNWVVVFKALVTVHHLMCYGNERFTQYLASSNCNFQLSNFLDKTGVQGYDMSTFIRRYAKYINEKALSYRTVAFDFCKVKRGKEDGILRTMNAENLLKTLPVLQNQLDALLEFDCTANDLTNGVISSSFMLLFRDLIRLFACYNDGIINLLEKYFDMNKKNCRDALDLYKKFLIRMDRVAEFLKVAETVGIDKGDIPDLTKAPSSLLDALEQHLASLEGKKGATATTPSGTAGSRQMSVKSGVVALSNTSSAFGSAAATASKPELNGSAAPGVDDSLKQKIIDEEQAALQQHKERRLKELQAVTSSTNPFLASPTSQPANSIDLFGSPTSESAPVTVSASKASDDLLCLTGNPFADVPPAQTAPPASNLWGSQNGFTSPPNSNFVPDTAFSSVFGNNAGTQAFLVPTKVPVLPPAGFDAFGDILQPTVNASQMQPNSGIGKPAVAAAPKVITGDLDSSLASLVSNLDMNRSATGSFQKGSQMWNSPKNTAKTGGINWSPQPQTGWAGAPQQGFQGMGGTAGAGTGRPADWSGGLMAGHFPSTGVAQQSGTGATGAPAMMGAGMGPRPPTVGGPMGGPPQPTQAPPLGDPFGAL